MAEATHSIALEDLRAAVASGMLTEAQAASLSALAASRAGKRAAMPAEDEPFEFFRGFSEIFVSVGLVILLTGISFLLGIFTGPAILILLPAICAAIAWWWAHYFTLKRRMNLPSMVLASAFGGGVFISALSLLWSLDVSPRPVMVGASLLSIGAMAVWYRVFRLPFSMFILGIFGLIAIYSLTASVEDVAGAARGVFGGPLFGMGDSKVFSVATLVFGVLAFLGGMWFDTRDPHRLGRHAATGFWLHMLAAPALVNVTAMNLMGNGSSTGMAALAVALVVISLLALVIDRRSFLTAGIVYIAIVISWLVRGQDGGGSITDAATVLLILGAVVTALGTWWVPLRAALMRALPDFPGKNRLPPYASA